MAREPRQTASDTSGKAVKLQEYRIQKTAVFDYYGDRVEPGEMATLDATLASKFHKLGYIDLDLDFEAEEETPAASTEK